MPALRYSEDTELNDALRARGIIPPLPTADSPPPSPTPVRGDESKAKLSELLDGAFTTDAVTKLELDDLDLDDELPNHLIEAWRESRLKELSGLEAIRRQARFGPGVRPIGREDYIREVNEASEKNLSDYDPDRQGARRAGTAVVLCLWNGSAVSRHLLDLLENLSSLYPTTHILSIPGVSCIANYPDANQPTLLCYRGGKCVRQYVRIGQTENDQSTRFNGLATRLEDLEVELASIGMLDEDLKDAQGPAPGHSLVSRKEGEENGSEDSDDIGRSSSKRSYERKNIRNGVGANARGRTDDEDSGLDI